MGDFLVYIIFTYPNSYPDYIYPASLFSSIIVYFIWVFIFAGPGFYREIYYDVVILPSGLAISFLEQS
jgi:hypothetical protein